MQIQLYLLNRTYIAEDKSTGLMASGDTAQKAESKLQALVEEYWEKKKVLVPINTEQPDKDNR